jgi:asparagine synthase (glutamine-hydrolysing)
VCGIAGIFDHDREALVDPAALAAMAQSLRHRGPDGEGFRRGPGYGLAHRRLAIVDVAGSPQPMADVRGRVFVVFNGEIYNYRELRAELERDGHEFATSGDTEVLLNGWRAWGEALPTRLRGMFAFALVDEDKHLLFAARDRLGKKPLHYVEHAGCVAFASEIKALLAGLPRFDRALDPEAVAQFLCLRYVPDPGCIFRGVRKLPPGCSLVASGGKVRVQRYWHLSFATPSGTPAEELEALVLTTLDDAVRMRLIGEVPLGAFLSGGVDSFAVVESMRRAAGDVVACTMGFDDPSFDEREEARAAAAHCGARLHEDVVHDADLEDLSWFVDTFDEPFADSSAIPTYHLSRLARRHVTVALSGDGGDECFAGYRRYKFDVLENAIRRALPAAVWRGLGSVYPKADFLPRMLRYKRTLENLGRDPALAYARSVSASLPEQVMPLLRGAPDVDPLAPVVAAYRAADGDHPLSRAAAADFATYLPGDILTKVDRASMAVSLEVRAPFLDHVMVELAASIPPALRLARGRSKAFLRRALARRLPAAALARRKRGFSVPLRRWMAGPLSAPLERALQGGPLCEVVDPPAALALLRQHRSGRSDHGELLWALFVLDRFLGRWGPA